MIWLRRIGIGFAILIVILAAGLSTLYAVSERRLAKMYGEVKPHPVVVHADSVMLERGRHLATAVGKCGDCHKADFGGGVFINDAAIGLVAAPNLTRGKGGVIGRLDDAMLERAIRHGVGYDGRGLWIMPAYEAQFVADDDLAAIIAYLRSVPPVDRETPVRHLGPVGRALFVGGQLPLVDAVRIDHAATHVTSMPPAVSEAYGKYSARIGGCNGCHGETLSGGPIPGTPPEWKPAANITPTGLKGYDEAAFFTLMRTGKRPAGTMVDSVMPYRYTRDLSDDEIRAIWMYLKTVPPKEYGGR